jgi:small basic protein (TIGR04137 family)
MSVHKSLKLKGSLKRSRNVLSRVERVEIMKARGTWGAPGKTKSVYGLPKTRVD